MKKSNRTVLIVILSLITFAGLSVHFDTALGHPVDDPTVSWSASDGDTLTGPNAPLTVEWSGDVINNTVTITRGVFVADISGTFVNISEDDHIYQIHVENPGVYYCHLSWNDALTDLDGYIYSDSSLENDYAMFDPYWSMATADFPEEASCYFGTGDYWIRVVWYSGNIPIDYEIFLGSDDYFRWEKTEPGSNQTVNTGEVPDNIYTFIASCFDSSGSFFSENITLTTANQFPPIIDWIAPVDGTVIQRGSDLTIQWQAIDPNPSETVFTTMFVRKPGAYSYSILFSSWITSSYTIDWDSSNFEKNGNYRFKIVVNNFNTDPSDAVYFMYTIEGESVSETTESTPIINTTEVNTSTSVSSTSITNPFEYSTSGYPFVLTVVSIIIMSYVVRRKKI